MVERPSSATVDTMNRMKTVGKLLLSYQLVISGPLSTLKDPVVVYTTTSSYQMVRCVSYIGTFSTSDSIHT